MIYANGGGGIWPPVNRYMFTRKIKTTFKQIEIPKILRPPSLLPQGINRPITESAIIWKLIAIKRGYY
jgi:hypothetical protein